MASGICESVQRRCRVRRANSAAAAGHARAQSGRGGNPSLRVVRWSRTPSRPQISECGNRRSARYEGGIGENGRGKSSRLAMSRAQETKGRALSYGDDDEEAQRQAEQWRCCRQQENSGILGRACRSTRRIDGGSPIPAMEEDDEQPDNERLASPQQWHASTPKQGKRRAQQQCATPPGCHRQIGQSSAGQLLPEHPHMEQHQEPDGRRRCHCEQTPRRAHNAALGAQPASQSRRQHGRGERSCHWVHDIVPRTSYASPGRLTSVRVCAGKRGRSEYLPPWQVHPRENR